jgi:FkbM family methyltransferase
LHRAGAWSWLERGRLIARMMRELPHEVDFEFFGHFDGQDGLFVDIGANIGQSAISFRIFNRSYRVLSFEPNPMLEPDLRFTKMLLGRGFEYRMHGIGDRNGAATFFYPEVDGIALTQEGSVVPEELGDDPVFRSRLRATTGRENFTRRELRLQIERLDDQEVRPDIIKIDVQGAEAKAVLGMEETLKRSRPLLMIENGPGMKEVAQLLEGRGYGAPWYYHPPRGRLLPAAPDDQHLNLFFIPSEKVQAWKSKGLCEP